MWRNSAIAWVISCVIGFTSLVAFGITTSSISAINYSGNFKPSGLIYGKPQPIRSDEYLKWTPSFIADYQGYPAESNLAWNSQLQNDSANFYWISKFATDLISIDQHIINNIEKLLPISQSFAFDWWYPILIGFIFVPLFLKKFQIPLNLSIPTTFLIFFTPGNQWWSYTQIGLIGSACAGLFFLSKFGETLTAEKHSKKLQFVFGLLTLMFTFRIPFAYQPWMIPIFTTLLTVTLAKLISENIKSYKNLKKFIILGFGILILTFFEILNQKEVIQNILQTVYPGQRRIDIVPMQFPNFSTWLTISLPENSKYLKAGNPSEVAIAFNEINILIISFLFSYIQKFKTEILARILLVASILLIIFELWILALWPKSLMHLNPLTLIPQARLAEISGTIGLILFPILIVFLRRYANENLKQFFIQLALSVSATIFFAFESLKNVEKTYDLKGINTKISFLFYLILFLVFLISVFLKKYGALGLWISVLILAYLSRFINPIQSGLGDLYNSDLAKTIRQIDRNGNEIWATSNIELSAILAANAAKTISGQQISGPNYEKWTKFDPLLETSSSWNRGASSIIFKWEKNPNPKITNPLNDLIEISIDPCSPEITDVGLTRILSDEYLNFPCFASIVEIPNYNGKTYRVFEIRP